MKTTNKVRCDCCTAVNYTGSERCCKCGATLDRIEVPFPAEDDGSLGEAENEEAANKAGCKGGRRWHLVLKQGSPSMAEHVLKTWPQYFDAVARGEKTFEGRWDDRGFKVGDTVILQRTRQESPSIVELDACGKAKYELRFTIGFILTGGQFGIACGYCVFSLLPIAQPTPNQMEDELLKGGWECGVTTISPKRLMWWSRRHTGWYSREEAYAILKGESK